MMNKLNANALTGAGAYVVGTLGGSMVSRVLADKIPLQNTKIKKGILMALGILGTAMIDSKQTSGKLLQGAAAGMAVTQANDLIKELVNPQEGIFKTALGSPTSEYVFVDTTPSYDDYPYVEETPQFLSGADQEFAVV